MFFGVFLHFGCFAVGPGLSGQMQILNFVASAQIALASAQIALAFGVVSGAPGAVQTPKIDDLRVPEK